MTTLGAAFDRAAARSASREAVVWSGGRWTYDELRARVDHVANQLAAGGVRPGDRVGGVLPNGPVFVVAALAAARSGAVWAPLAAGSTRTEIDGRLGSVALVLTDVALEPALSEVAAPIWVADTDQLFGAPSTPTRPPAPDPAAPALSHHTTGQRGPARRVTRTHGGLVAEVAAVASRLQIGPEDRVLGWAPLHHSYGFVNGVLCALLRGATLVLVDPGSLPRTVLATASAERATGLVGVPFLYDALAAARAPDGLDLSRLRYCLSAGAPLPAASAAAFTARFGVGVQQLYGTTETGVVAVDPPGAAAVSVGRPLDGVEVRIVDDAGRPVPTGRVGNVGIRSAAAATAYDADGPQDERGFAGGWFVPGDVGWVDVDGRLSLTGRTTDFVNVGGNKVDPAEVEEVVRGLVAVEDVVVVGRADPVGGECVVAVIVAREPLAPERVRAWCGTHLAAHKVPRRVVFVDAIPRSPLGKVLRGALQEVA